MNGDNILLDTNIILYLLAGDKTLATLLQNRHVYVSFITELELLGYYQINEVELGKIESLLKECIVVEMNTAIKSLVIDLKRQYKLKLPDAIIAATGLYMNMPLISADKSMSKIEEMNFVLYEY